MITPTPHDSLAALKKASPGDPLIPAFEHINSNLDSMKSDAKSIARDAKSLLKTRRLVFLGACLLSAGAASAGTWYAMRGNPSPDIQILHRAGLEVLVTDSTDKVSIAFIGPNPTPSVIPPKRGLMLTWKKQK
jgi:hypothetical protein